MVKLICFHFQGRFSSLWLSYVIHHVKGAIRMGASKHISRSFRIRFGSVEELIRWEQPGSVQNIHLPARLSKLGLQVDGLAQSGTLKTAQVITWRRCSGRCIWSKHHYINTLLIWQMLNSFLNIPSNRKITRKWDENDVKGTMIKGDFSSKANQSRCLSPVAIKSMAFVLLPIFCFPPPTQSMF